MHFWSEKNQLFVGKFIFSDRTVHLTMVEQFEEFEEFEEFEKANSKL